MQRPRPGAAVEGDAEFVHRADWPGALAALRRAYGVRFQLSYVASQRWHQLARRGAERHEIIRIAPPDPGFMYIKPQRVSGLYVHKAPNSVSRGRS